MGFPLDRGSGHKKVAGIAYILFGDSFRNGLGAFKLGTRIEVSAILAGSQIRAAFRASALHADFYGGRDDGPAHRTP